MKTFWVCAVLALILGTGSGWGYNYALFGQRDGRFGMMTLDGSINGLNVMTEVSKRYSKSLAKAEMQNDPTHDFGAMAPNETGNHTFVIKNIGEEPLKLELGASTCKCTLGDLKAEELQPGESTEIELEWTVNGDKTEFEQHAQLRTNDPESPAIDLRVKGLILNEVEMAPKDVIFDQVASGDSFELDATVYSYYEHGIEPVEQMFGSDQMNELAEFSIEPFDPSTSDSVHNKAKQGFKLHATVKPGLRQGAVETNWLLRFKKRDENGGYVDSDPSEEGPDTFYLSSRAVGRVVGYLEMFESPKLKVYRSGGYVYNFGQLDASASTIGKTFVVLKGGEKDKTNLTLGEVHPEGVIQATLGEPKGRGSMKLYPLTLEVMVGDEPIDMQGKNKDDFGWVWIESDNPKVGRMRVAVTVAAEARP